ncbi:hypothetical protein H7F51_09380 [Novosphingobium flavum]|uniref:Transcriptional regulator n=1 Tax=Novosphingobium flavum TaxID=1778672 RepID=A0A7X1FRP5_9SPHN|nr:hypothetical protein [Novosphingobium flavum]MBC2665735.1 hypothetical protein [Novosphingobium flavum]
MSIPAQDVQTFIAASFRSVWALEVLCHLRAQRDRWVSAQALVEALRASSLVVEQSFSNLIAAGLLIRDEAGRVQYAPANAELDTLVEACEQLYQKSPSSVRRQIVAAANPGIAAFANAFRLKDQ